MSRLPDFSAASHPVRRRLRFARLWPLTPPVAVALSALLAVVGAAVAALLLLTGQVAGVVHPVLAAAVGALAGTLPLGLLLVRLSVDHERGRHLAAAAGAMDPVTGVSSRANFLSLAEREFARSRRYGIGAALLLVDVDRFRRLVDTHDGAAGDMMLREIAASTQATLRGADALARFGHAQIAVFLAHSDPLGALDVAERIRERAEQIEVPWRDQRLHATVSVGVVLMRPAHLSLQAVIDDAEAALGAARHAGGNCVRAAPVDSRRSSLHGSLPPSVGDNQAAGS